MPNSILNVSRNSRLTVVDQILSSGTNFIPAILAAKTLDPAGFGVFALLQAVYVTVAGALRAGLVETSIVTTSASPRETRGISMNVATWLLAPILVAGALAAPLVGRSVALAVASLVVILLQDVQRIEAISTDRVRHAVASDGLWLLLTASVIMAGYSLGGLRSPFAIFIVWAACSVPGVGAVALVQKFRPRLRLAKSFAISQWRTIAAHSADWALRQGAVQVTVYATALVAGLAEMGNIRLAQLILGPMNVIFAGVTLAAMPVAAQAWKNSRGALDQVLRRLSIVQALLPLLFGAVVLLLPAGWLAIPFGGQAAGLKPYFAPQVVLLTVSGVAATAQMGMKVLQMRSQLVRLRVFTVVLSLPLTIVPAVVFQSALAALWGLSLGNALSAVVWVRALKSGSALSFSDRGAGV